jgi:Tfp pilus assembly protein PilN
MTQVNLLPPQIQERQKTRRLTAAIVAGGGAVIGLLLFVFVLQSARLSDADRELAEQRNVNSGLRGQIAGLQQFESLQQTLADRQAMRTGILQDQVLWSSVLHDVSLVIPGEMWITSLTGTLTPPVPQAAPVPSATTTTATTPPAAASPASVTTLVGSIQFEGSGFDHPTLALWLTRLEEVTGWVNPWISTATKSTVDAVEVVQFSGSIDLNQEATTDGRAK